MSNLKPELSGKSKYYISRHRYYELKHFCLQYPEWKRELYSISSITSQKYSDRVIDNMPTDRTQMLAEKRELYLRKMSIIEQACIKADPDIYDYILKAVTEGWSFDQLNARERIPCSRDTWYDRYRKFFYILDKLTNRVKCNAYSD